MRFPRAAKALWLTALTAWAILFLAEPASFLHDDVLFWIVAEHLEHDTWTDFGPSRTWTVKDPD